MIQITYRSFPSHKVTKIGAHHEKFPFWVTVSCRSKTCFEFRFIHSFIHSVFCLKTGPKPPPKRFLHIVRSRASSFKWEYPLLFLRSSSSFLCLLPRLLVTSIPPFIFPSITCFRRQFLRKMWPIQLAFRFFISCRIFLCSLIVGNNSFQKQRYHICEMLPLEFRYWLQLISVILLSNYLHNSKFM